MNDSAGREHDKIETGADMKEPTGRFSNRVADYISYRPSYPREVADILISGCNLDHQSTIADIGSGTGIFSKLLLDKDLRVIGVEPNESMRKAAEQQLTEYKKFISVEGQSERTNLADSSIDLITAAQAFHWFKYGETKREFVRILKPAGHVALIWNRRKLEQPFHKEYDGILRKFVTDYDSVNHTNILYEEIKAFFSPHSVLTFKFENSQSLDLTGFLGRIRSSSYTPEPDTNEHGMLTEAAEELFSRYQCDGEIAFEYLVDLYLASYSS